MHGQTGIQKKLHGQYLICLDAKVNAFLKGDEQTKQESEWCLDEKRAYFNHLREHHRTEFENILRLEGQNY